jgi:hypothetical protein
MKPLQALSVNTAKRDDLEKENDEKKVYFVKKRWDVFVTY